MKMKSPFDEWLKEHQQQLIDFYYEGSCIDRDMLTKIEEFARKAFEAGFEEGYLSVPGGYV